jgi:Ca2+-binding RTX toxin-like protein
MEEGPIHERTKALGMGKGFLGACVVALALGSVISATTGATGVRTCGGKPVTIAKGNGDNLITGTKGADVIAAGGGNDLIQANEGRDRVCGEGGNDLIQGDAGKGVYLDGGPGRDQIEGDDNADLIILGGGRDSGSVTDNPYSPSYSAGAYGFAGDDDEHGGRGDDELFGNEGDDTLRGERGTDSCDAGGDPGDVEKTCETDPV